MRPKLGVAYTNTEKEGIYKFLEKYMYVPVFGEERNNDSRNEKGMVVCNYGGRYATVERGGGQGIGLGVICGLTNVWCRLKNNMYVASKK